MSVIYAFGDSITYGEYDELGSGWANRLRLWVDSNQKKNHSNFFRLFYNLGIPGEDTSGLVARFDSELNARAHANEEKIFIFAYGANDSAFIFPENKFKLLPEEFATNLILVIEKAKKISEKILILNITPVFEEVTFKSSRNNKSRTNEYILPYNKAIKDISDTQKIVHVDIFSEYMNRLHKELLSEDGLHPNTQGHIVIYELVKKELEKFI